MEPEYTNTLPDKTSIYDGQTEHDVADDQKTEAIAAAVEAAPSLVSWNVGARVDPSVTVSIMRDGDTQRKQKQESIKTDDELLFWLRNCLAQWRLINNQIESAAAERRAKVMEDMKCVALAVVKKVGEVSDAELRLCEKQFDTWVAKLHQDLDRDTLSLTGSKDDLFERILSLHEAMSAVMERIPLTEGAVLGEKLDRANLDSFIRALNIGNEALSRFSTVLEKFSKLQSYLPLSEDSLEEISKKENPLKSLEAISDAANQLGSSVKVELDLLQEIATLTEQKYTKLLKLNSMKVYCAQVSKSCPSK